MTVGVFLLDDHEVVRQGLRSLMEASGELEVVGEASTVADAMARIPTSHPDVAVLDVRVPDGNGVEACREIRSNWPDVAVVILTSYADDEALFAAVVAGASGYLLKQVGGTDLVESIKRAADGQSLIDQHLYESVIDRLRNGPKEDPRLARLTDQERKILSLIADGKSNREIAQDLFLSEKTVRNYVSNLLAKLGMERRTQAASFAVRLEEKASRAYKLDDGGT